MKETNDMAVKKNGKKNGKTARKTSTGKTMKQVKPRSSGQQLSLWYEGKPALRSLREKKDLSRKELRIKAKVVRGTIGKSETKGKVDETSARKIAKALGGSMNNLFVKKTG